MTVHEWLVVIGPECTVLAVEGAPGAWVGARLDDRDDAPVALRDAARAVAARLVDPMRATSVERATVAVDGGPIVQIVGVEAIGVRRVATDLASLLTSALAVMRAQADALEIAVTVECGEGAARIFVDPEKLGWVVTTLVGNALRHVRRGTRSRPGGTVRVTVAPDAAGGWAVVTVRDDGPGIPAESLPTLFQRRAGAVHAQALGLSLARDVVAAHGGTLTVESATSGDARGTAVTLRLPAR